MSISVRPDPENALTPIAVRLLSGSNMMLFNSEQSEKACDIGNTDEGSGGSYRKQDSNAVNRVKKD